MSVKRLIGLSTACALATACLPPSKPSMVAPQQGPKSRIDASYSGGLASRTVRANFWSEKDAYALVGHLGGDGVIRILYPTNPRDRGTVRGKETYRTPTVFAVHDGLPELYSRTRRPFRDVGARIDSYDGGGFGYFFMITSRFPLLFDEISEGSLFDEIEVPDYWYNGSDPRYTIRELGDLVSGGSPYTLEFASSFGSVNMSTAFDARFDCLMLTSMGLSSLFAYGSPFRYTNPWIGSSGFNNGCGNSYYAYGPTNRYASSYSSNRQRFIPLPPTGNRPTGTIRPPWERRDRTRRTNAMTATTRSGSARGSDFTGRRRSTIGGGGSSARTASGDSYRSPRTGSGEARSSTRASTGSSTPRESSTSRGSSTRETTSRPQTVSTPPADRSGERKPQQ